MLAPLLLILAVLLAGCAPQSTSAAPLAEANRDYEAGRHVEAVSAYEALVEAGADDGTLYYNLGNAYFKSGDVGRAILNYRRAQRLLPRDSDVAANLQLARTQTVDRLDPESIGGPVALARLLLLRWTTLDEAAWVMLGVWVAFCVLLMASIRWPHARRRLRYGIVLVAVLLVLSIVSVAVPALDERGRSAAVAVWEAVDAFSGPGEDYLMEFRLHAGAEVHVLEQRADWRRIALPGSLQGWVPAEAVETI